VSEPSLDRNSIPQNNYGMKINQNQASIIKSALHEWKNSGDLDETMALKLESSLEVQTFDWKKLAKYSFWISLICIVTAVSSVLLDKVLIDLLESLFNAPYPVKFFTISIIAGLIYRYGLKRRQLYPAKIFSNEAILFLGVLATAGAVYQLGRIFDTGSGHFSLLILLSVFIYGILGMLFKSNLIWLFALISLGSWMGTETGYMSGWGAYYLGMNYPLRFVLFGGLLIAAALSFEKKHAMSLFFRSTLAMGLLYLFIALWLMSIFGNYGDMTLWDQVKQIELFHWSLLFGFAAGGSIYHGLRFENGMTKGFGITFLFINLYTRFFEYFWEATHKAIFFSLLALSFWFLGNKAEKIWTFAETKKT
jgi:hypothetical protein